MPGTRGHAVVSDVFSPLPVRRRQHCRRRVDPALARLNRGRFFISEAVLLAPLTGSDHHPGRSK
jgi:hypothetical protein